MRQHPELEDRERLERFLEWRRADDESRKAARRHAFGMATLAVAVAALITATWWYAIGGNARAALTPTAKLDTRVALAPGVDGSSNPKLVSPAASSTQAPPPEATAAEAPSTPAAPTPAEATPAPAEALATSTAPLVPSPSAVAGSRAAARLKSPPPRRSTRVVREAGRIPAAPATPDVAAARPPEPAPISATPMAPPPAIVPSTPRATVPPTSAESVRSETATPVAPPPPVVVRDIPRAAVPPANAESARSEASTPVAAPPITASPATRTEDATAAAPWATAPQTASIRSDAAASVSEPPARLAPPAPPSTGEVLLKWAGYIPEVRMAKAIYRWAKKQPPADGVRPGEPQSPQSR
jgi:hypothetical protein